LCSYIDDFLVDGTKVVCLALIKVFKYRYLGKPDENHVFLNQILTFNMGLYREIKILLLSAPIATSAIVFMPEMEARGYLTIDSEADELIR
jgi:hypothetical protein